MGKIVGAFGTAHILMNPEGVEDAADRVFDGMKEVGRRVRETDPDVVVVVSGDHMFNISTDFEVPLAVGTAEEWHPVGELKTGTEPFPGDADFAHGFVAHAYGSGFELAKTKGLRPDHGVTMPARFISPKNELKIVPVLININMEPLPEPARAYRLGEVLKDYVENVRPTGERVAVVGTGGLSHWLFVPRMGEVNEEWDRRFLADLAAGEAKKWTEQSAAQVVEDAGNGGIEITAWLMAAATLPGETGKQVYYEAIPQWSTGFGGLAVIPQDTVEKAA